MALGSNSKATKSSEQRDIHADDTVAAVPSSTNEDDGGGSRTGSSSSSVESSSTNTAVNTSEQDLFFYERWNREITGIRNKLDKKLQHFVESSQHEMDVLSAAVTGIVSKPLLQEKASTPIQVGVGPKTPTKKTRIDEEFPSIPLSPANRKTQAKKRNTSSTSWLPRNPAIALLAKPSPTRSCGSSAPPINTVMSRASSKASKASDKTELAHNLSRRRARRLQRLRKNETVLKVVNEESEYKRTNTSGSAKHANDAETGAQVVSRRAEMKEKAALGSPKTNKVTEKKTSRSSAGTSSDDELGPQLSKSVGTQESSRNHQQTVGQENASVTVGTNDEAICHHKLDEANERPIVPPKSKSTETTNRQGNGDISQSSNGPNIRRTDSNQSCRSSYRSNANDDTDAISVARSERDHRDAMLDLEHDRQAYILSERRRKYFFPSTSMSSSEKKHVSTTSDSEASTNDKDGASTTTSGTSKRQQTKKSAGDERTKSPATRSGPKILKKKSFASAHSSGRPVLSPVAESSIESPRNFWLQRERDALQQQANQSAIGSMRGSEETSWSNLSSIRTNVPPTEEVEVHLQSSAPVSDSADHENSNSTSKQENTSSQLILKSLEKTKFQRKGQQEEPTFMAVKPRNVRPSLIKKVERVRSAESSERSRQSSNDNRMLQEQRDQAAVQDNSSILAQVQSVQRAKPTLPISQQQNAPKELEGTTSGNQSFSQSKAQLQDVNAQYDFTNVLALEDEVVGLEKDILQKRTPNTRLVSQRRNAAPKPETLFQKNHKAAFAVQKDKINVLRPSSSNSFFPESRLATLVADHRLSIGRQSQSTTSSSVSAEPPAREIDSNPFAARTPEEPPPSSDSYSHSITFFKMREKKNDAPTTDDLVIEEVKRPDAPEVGEAVMSPCSSKLSGPGTSLSPTSQSISGNLPGALPTTLPAQESLHGRLSINSGKEQSFSPRSTDILSISTSGNSKHNMLETANPENLPAASSLASTMSASSVGACTSKALSHTPSTAILSPTSSSRSVLLGSDQSKSDLSLMDTNDSTPIRTNGGNHSSLASSSRYRSLRINTNPSMDEDLPESAMKLEATSSITTALHHFLDPHDDGDNKDDDIDWTRFEFSPTGNSPTSTGSVASTPPHQREPESSSTTARNKHQRLQLDISSLQEAEMSQSKGTTPRTVSTLSCSHMYSHNQTSSLRSPEEKGVGCNTSESASATMTRSRRMVHEELPYYFGGQDEEKKEEEEACVSVSDESDNEELEDDDDDEMIVRMEHVKNKHIVDPYGDAGLYTGVLIRDYPDSYGIMEYEDGRVYTGTWKRGRWDGHGKTLFTNGDCYTGEYLNDMRQGVGRYEWLDGRIYDGRFEADQRQGTGIYSWPDGSVYSGDFHRGLRHGHGTYTFADGSVYNGAWKNGKQHGIGECVWKDGRCYRGEWENGQAHGYGIEMRADGTTRYDGLWKHDRPVKLKNRNRVEQQFKLSTLWNMYSSTEGAETTTQSIDHGKDAAASASSHQRQSPTASSTSPAEDEVRFYQRSTKNPDPAEKRAASPHHKRATVHSV